MGIFDENSDKGVAPETGMPNLVMEDPNDTDWDDEPEEDSEPVDHDNILTTPVSMPDFKKGRTPSLQKDLEAMYTMLGTGVFPFDNQTGVVIIESAPNCASALYELSTKNPRVKRSLQSLMSAGAYGAVISAHLPIAVMVATKYIPAVRENYSRIMNNRDAA